MRSIILNDGTEYPVDWWNGDKGIFYANLETSDSIANIAIKFGNSDLTSVMTIRIGNENDNPEYQRYEGYTRLTSIAKDSWRSGTVLVTLLAQSGQP